ncbi:SDR family oxidoreductase [Microvirga antarctica]|uniref:SDR family oxidoreductase n=1 Tax=Microvirga antarctica TaxID=2819233 RepID=UPI001B30A475|nr:SDR family oxidoreductase [Microvirga antarctica]
MNAKSKEFPVLMVTGGNRGIGRAVALAAAAARYRIAFTYRSDQQAAEKTVAAIESLGSEAIAVYADVARQDDVRAAFASAKERFGRLDALVNNAGIIGEPRSIIDVDEQHLDLVFRTNVFGAFYCVAEAVRQMSKQAGGEGGVIVNVSSAAARHGGMPQEAHYASSKGAIDSLTLSLAKELAPMGIRVNAIRPGLIDTAIHSIHGGDEAIRRMAPTVPLGRAGTAQEVADTVLFLLQDKSSYIHGALIDISGGR